jgi:hypothetical protein
MNFSKVSNIDQRQRNSEAHAEGITAPSRQLPLTESVVLPPAKGVHHVFPFPNAMSNVSNRNHAGPDYARPLWLRYPDV